MNRIIATLAATAALVAALTITPAAHADDTTCAVQPLIAGECVTQPVADFALGLMQERTDLIAANEVAWAAFRTEQAAHNDTHLLLAEANAHASYFQTELANAQARVVRKNLTIARLRAALDR